MSTTDITTPPAILIQGTHGADNAEKAALPFIIGNVVGEPRPRPPASRSSQRRHVASVSPPKEKS